MHPESDRGAGSVDPLRGGLRGCPEGCWVGDLVPVAICGDDKGASAPLRPSPSTRRGLAERLGPRPVGLESGAEDSFGPVLNELATLGQSASPASRCCWLSGCRWSRGTATKRRWRTAADLLAAEPGSSPPVGGGLNS